MHTSRTPGTSRAPGTPRTPGTSKPSGGPWRRWATAPAALLLALVLAGCGGAGDDDTARGGNDKGAAARQDTGKKAAGLDGGQADRGRGRAGDTGPAGGREGGRARGPGGVARPADSHVVRSASLTVRVKDVPRALDRARAVAEGAGGLVGEESTDRDRNGDDRSRVVLRVPQDRYGQVLSALAGTGRLVSRSARAEDVTEQVVDVESRIRTQRASVARVRALMDRAAKIGDIVSLEGELSSRQSDLESLLAQQASLKDRTTMATITLALTETPRSSAADGGGDGTSFTDALSGGWGAFVTVLRWVAVALAAALPFAAVAALLGLLWLRVARPRIARRGAAGPARFQGPAAGPPAGPGGPEAPRGPGTPDTPAAPDGT
ncbi:DUF4349 domain-containing protein [Streptomyces sp. NPDC017940]|uniref:DUF4349 domain-containing protein n=1 Tax=Streptomyces sp. NPDC017940 TaxID=3365017 RepID=UPI0037AEEDDC